MQLFLVCLLKLLPSWSRYHFKAINLTISLAISNVMSIVLEIIINLLSWFL